MSTFTIDDQNHIAVFASAEEAAQTSGSATVFDSQAAFAKVSVGWPLSRFVAVYNGISGNGELKKFADRKQAVARIWKAIQPVAGRAGKGPVKPPPAAKPAQGAKTGKK